MIHVLTPYPSSFLFHFPSPSLPHSLSFTPPLPLPLPSPSFQHYSVVDTSEGQVFIGVYHDINNTNLYLSEVAGVDYSLSLTSVVSPPESDWIQGVPEFDLHVVSPLLRCSPGRGVWLGCRQRVCGLAAGCKQRGLQAEGVWLGRLQAEGVWLGCRLQAEGVWLGRLQAEGVWLGCRQRGVAWLQAAGRGGVAWLQAASRGGCRQRGVAWLQAEGGGLAAGCRQRGCGLAAGCKQRGLQAEGCGLAAGRGGWLGCRLQAEGVWLK